MVYKAENLHDNLTEGGPKGTRYNRSKSEWFDCVLFEDLFNKLILPFYKKFPSDIPKAMIKVGCISKYVFENVY